MTSPTFTHLRVHSEYSIVDGLVRIDDLVGAAVKDKQPALAVTDLANMFCPGALLQGGARQGDQADRRGRRLDHQRRQPRQAVPPADPGEEPDRLPAAVRPAVAAWLTNQYKGRAEIRVEWLEALATSVSTLEPEVPQANALIVLSGAQFGDVGQAIDNGDIAKAEALPRAGPHVPGPFLRRDPARRPGQPGAAGAPFGGAGRPPRAAGGGDPPGAVHQQGRIHRPRSAHLYRRGRDAGQRQARAPLQREMCFKSQAEMAELFADLPGALANSVEIAKRCNVVLTLGKPQLPNFPTPPGMTIDEFLVAESKKGLEERLEQLFPDPESARRSVRATRRAWSSRTTPSSR
jgi:DNA polymerase-3 subunit alpha